MLNKEQKREGMVEIVRNVSGTKSIEELRRKIGDNARAVLQEFINNDNVDLLNSSTYQKFAAQRFSRQAKQCID